MEGRIFVGTLKGFDQKTNLILSQTKERVFSSDIATQEEPVGLFLLRGEAIATVGLSVDDRLIDFTEHKVRFLPFPSDPAHLNDFQAAPLKPITH